jgi:hypothetical protein
MRLGHPKNGRHSFLLTECTTFGYDASRRFEWRPRRSSVIANHTLRRAMAGKTGVARESALAKPFIYDTCSAGPVPRRVGRGIGVQAALTAAIVGQLTSGHGRRWRQPFMNGANRSKSPSLVTRVIPPSRQEAASSASLRSEGLS